LVEYENIPPTIGAVISASKATLHECQTVYSIEDIYLMLEVISIDAHNTHLAQEYYRRQQEK
jgi:hypothetical protein